MVNMAMNLFLVVTPTCLLSHFVPLATMLSLTTNSKFRIFLCKVFIRQNRYFKFVVRLKSNSSLHHVGAHVPVEHGHGNARVVFKYQTIFIFHFFIFWSFDTRKGLAELVQGQNGHVDFSILFYKWRRGTFLTMFMKLYWPKLQSGRFSILYTFVPKRYPKAHKEL